jgi:hypothetical protein
MRKSASPQTLFSRCSVCQQTTSVSPQTQSLAGVLHAGGDTLHGDDHGVFNAGLVRVLVSIRVIRVAVQQARAILIDRRVVGVLTDLLARLDCP